MKTSQNSTDVKLNAATPPRQPDLVDNLSEPARAKANGAANGEPRNDAQSTEPPRKTPSEPLSMRDNALALAQRGFKVFPIPANSKKAITSFPKIATDNPARVAKLWTEPVGEDSSPDNIGILAGDEWVVIDVDVKQGQVGKQSLELLIMMGLDADTLTAETPTGGLHLFYRIPPGHGPVKSDNRGKLGRNIDVKSGNAYVVGAESEINGKLYRWINDVPPLEAPPWLLEQLGKRPEKAAKSTIAAGVERLGKRPEKAATGTIATGVELDLPRNIARAIDLLRNAKPAVEGEHGNDRTYVLACNVKDLGISENATYLLMLEHWNNRCKPPWDGDELARIVASAFRNGSRPIGAATTEADFSDVSHLVSEKSDKLVRGIRLVPFDEIKLGTAQRYLIKNLIPRVGLTIIFGESRRLGNHSGPLTR